MTKGQTQVFQLSIVFSIFIQYTIWYALLLHNFSKKFNMKTWNNKCSNKAECDNGIPLKITNQTDPSIKKNGTWTVARVVSYWINNTYIISLNVSNFSSLCVWKKLMLQVLSFCWIRLEVVHVPFDTGFYIICSN